MPGAAGNDFCNQQLVNAVTHNAASDDERGLPAVGKQVYRTDLGYLEVCTSTSPDPTLNGGGTWRPSATGSGFGTYTPDIVYDAFTDFTTDGGEAYGWYQDFGDVFICGGHFSMAGAGPYFPSAVGGESIDITMPFRLHDLEIYGVGTGLVQGTVYYNGGADSVTLVATPGSTTGPPGVIRGVGFDPATGAGISLSYDDVGQYFAAGHDLTWLVTCRKYVP